MIEGERLGERMDEEEDEVGDKGEARAFKRSRYPIELFGRSTNQPSISSFVIPTTPSPNSPIPKLEHRQRPDKHGDRSPNHGYDPPFRPRQRFQQIRTE